MTIEQYLFAGDSLTAGAHRTNTAAGASGCWAELVAEALCNLRGKPLLGPGIRLQSLDFQGGSAPGIDDEWTHTGSWTATASTVSYNKAPYSDAYIASAGDTATFTKPPPWRAITSFCIYWIDYSGGGAWQYRIDGGTWTSMGQTITSDGSLNKFYINTPITSTVEFRAFNGTSNVGICLVGIEPFFADPTTDGIIVQNIGVGGTRLHLLTAATGGDPLAFVDTVKLGTGSPPSNYPNAGALLMHINDVLYASTSQWATDLTTFYNRLAPYGPVAFMNVWECLPATYNTTTQASYRTQTKTTAAGLGVPVLDHFDVWSAMGIATNAAMTTYGLLLDGTHETNLGHNVLWPRIYEFVRLQFLAGLAGPARYPVQGTRAATVYAGTRPAQVPAAGSPLTI